MELNKLNSDDYIFLRLTKDIDNAEYREVKGDVISFTRDYLEANVYSSVYYDGISEILDIVRKQDTKETDILPTQNNESMTVTEDKVIDIRLMPNRRYVLNDWLINHLTNDDEFYDFDEGTIKITDANMRNIDKYCKKTRKEDGAYSYITTGDHTVRLKLTFQKGEALDFTDPGVMSLLYDPNTIELLASSEVILGSDKEECFKNEYQNTFFALDGHICASEAMYRYFRINAGINTEYFGDLGTYSPLVALKDKSGNFRVVYLEENCYSEKQFKREDIKALKKVATEIPLKEAKKLHANVLKRHKQDYEKSMREFRKKEEKHAKKLEKAYEKSKGNAEIFPGTCGDFVHTFKDSYTDTRNKKYTLDEIKTFYTKLKDINEEILKYMYFYGGTIPYMLLDANTTREFGDVDIFVPIEAMRYVREEIMRQPSFENIFDSIDVTSRVNLTASIPANKEEDTTGLGVLYALMNPNADDETLNELFNNRPNCCLQDFGLKAKLFGVNISIFPIYQYNQDLMAKSFNITDVYEYLLAVRVMNNMEIKDFAKNVKICGNNLNILPIEYVIISKESAIEQGYEKRMTKDKEDLEFIDEHKEELGIDEELKSKLKENYPDYSISKAYFAGPSKVETISGEKYKDLMLLNKGGWLS